MQLPTTATGRKNTHHRTPAISSHGPSQLALRLLDSCSHDHHQRRQARRELGRRRGHGANEVTVRDIFVGPHELVACQSGKIEA
jgi:hypothetical protein